MVANYLSPECSLAYINPFQTWAEEWLSAEKNENKTNIRNSLISKIRKYLDTIFVIPENCKDDSWYDTARNFIYAIVLGLYEDLTISPKMVKKTKRKKVLPEQINWTSVLKIFYSFSWGDSYRQSFMDGGYFESRDHKSSMAYAYAKSTIHNAKNTLANYMGFVDLFLRNVSDPKIQRISMYNNFDLKMLGEKPMVLFLVYDISDTVVREYVNTTVAFIVNGLLEHSHKTGKMLQTPVTLCFDEFPTLKPNAVYPNILATGRGSGIFMHMICQSITQLRARYPEDYQSMIENCDLTVFMGTNDSSTAEYFSKELGNTTIPDPVAFLKNTFSGCTVPVVSVDKLMHRMSPGEVYIKVHHQEPIHGQFEFYYRTPQYQKHPETDMGALNCKIPEKKCEYDAPWMHSSDDAGDDDEDFF